MTDASAFSASSTGASRPVVGHLAAVAAAFSYGVGTLVSQRIVTEYASPMVGTAFSLMFGTAIVAALFSRHVPGDVAAAPRRAWLFVMLAGCASAWGVGSYFMALNYGPVVLVAPLVGVYPLVTIALAHVFLQRLERITWQTVLGATLVVLGAALIALG